jgi:hypothetical protein
MRTIGYFTSSRPRVRKRRMTKFRIDEVATPMTSQDPAVAEGVRKAIEAGKAALEAKAITTKGLSNTMSSEFSKAEIEQAYEQALKDWSSKRGLTPAQGAIKFYDTPQARVLMKSLKDLEQKRAAVRKQAADGSAAAASLDSLAEMERLPGESYAKSYDRLLQSEDGKALYGELRKAQYVPRYPGSIEKWNAALDREVQDNPGLTRAETARALSKRLVSLFAQARLSGLPDLD